jgi:hypothetical protein
MPSVTHGCAFVVSIRGWLRSRTGLTGVFSAYSPTLRTPYLLYISAVMKGSGGGFSVVNAGQAAFIADTSPAKTRSFYLGLGLVMFWIASAIAPLVSAVLLDEGRFATNFGIAVGAWMVYLTYLILILRETRVPKASENLATTSVDSGAVSTGQHPSTQWTPRVFFTSLYDPLTLIFGDATLRWLGISTFLMLFALGALGVLIVYCDRVFGLSPSQVSDFFLCVFCQMLKSPCDTGWNDWLYNVDFTGCKLNCVASMQALILRQISVLCILPAFIMLYRRVAWSGDVQPNTASDDNGSSDRTPLLAESEGSEGMSASLAPSAVERLRSAAQELTITRICFFIDAIGLLCISLARNATDVTISEYFSSFSALRTDLTPLISHCSRLARCTGWALASSFNNSRRSSRRNRSSLGRILHHRLRSRRYSQSHLLHSLRHNLGVTADGSLVACSGQHICNASRS